MTQRIELTVHQTERRSRLEDLLFDRFPNLSRMYLRDIVKSGKCEVNGRNENIGHRLRAGDFIEIELDPARENAMRAEQIPLDIVFEDADLIVVNKPAGMLVHPTHRDKTGTLLNALSFQLNAKGLDPPVRPGLVHRLDRETSGLLVVAKNARTHRILSRQFQKKSVQKRYIGLVLGRVRAKWGVIEAPIARYAEQKQWDLKTGGKHSITRFSVLKRYDSATLLELEPVTGRTNQLRIHCAALGHPILGDKARNGGPSGRLCLHAYLLDLNHPSDGRRIRFELPLTEEVFRQAWISNARKGNSSITVTAEETCRSHR